MIPEDTELELLRGGVGVGGGKEYEPVYDLDHVADHQVYTPHRSKTRSGIAIGVFVTIFIIFYSLVPTRTSSATEDQVVQLFRSGKPSSTRFVFSNIYGGKTNQLYVTFKLLYLAKLLKRTAILSPLTPSPEHPSEEGLDPLSHFFDLEQFSTRTGVDVIEWTSYQSGSNSTYHLTCWSWTAGQTTFQPLSDLSVMIDYIPAPALVLADHTDWYARTTFPTLIHFLQNYPKDDYLDQILNNTSITRPSDDLMCLDNTFYIAPSIINAEGQVEIDTTYQIEEFSPLDPVWTEIGRYFRYSKSMDEIVDGVMAESGILSPNFIGVHIRRDDFIKWNRVSNDTMAAFDGFKKAINVLIDRLWEEKEIRVTQVVMVTDSHEQDLLDGAAALGWRYLNHAALATGARFGTWAPTMVDSAILTRGIGFVGTTTSTFSYLAARRVETWRGGLTMMV